MSTSRPVKRRRRDIGIGAPSADDSPASQINAPSSAAFATRRVITHVQPLASMCLDVFIQNFPRLSSDSNSWLPTEMWDNKIKAEIMELPDSVVPKLLQGLAQFCPSLLSTDLVREVSALWLLMQP